MTKYLWMILIAAWACTSCDSGASTSSLFEAQGRWQLQNFALDDGSTTEIPFPENYTIRFNADGNAQVRADCNLCTGDYQVESTTLTIGLLACTRAFCGPDSFDNQYIAALSSTSSYTRRGDELSLDYTGGAMRFVVDDLPN